MKNTTKLVRYEKISEKIFAGILILAVAGGILLSLTGCGSTGEKIAKGLTGKSVTLDGGMSYLKGTMSNSETGVPEITSMTGKISHKSRVVGIPADQKTPHTAYFKATKSTGIFGGEEIVVEFDYTAGSDADAKAAMDNLTRLRTQAAEAMKKPAPAAKQPEAVKAASPDTPAK